MRPLRAGAMAYMRAAYTTGTPAMTRTTVFLSNRSQAVRLPKSVAFPDGVREVAVLRDGDRRVVVPADRAWDDFFAAPGADLGGDLGGRDQPAAQDRERL